MLKDLKNLQKRVQFDSISDEVTTTTQISSTTETMISMTTYAKNPEGMCNFCPLYLLFEQYK